MGVAPNINRLWADLIVEELVRHDITRFIIAPGSRSAPLVAAVVAHRRAEPIIHFDERGTGFYALGAGRSSGCPAVLITTSGTAVANLLPAVIEASQDFVPLIVISADRPPELVDTGANQAIDQTRIFGNYVRWFSDLSCPSPEIPVRTVLATIDHAVARALGSPAGPVHLNLPFREPLAPTETAFQDHYGGIAGWMGTSQPLTRHPRSHVVSQEATMDNLCSVVETARRGLIVVGGLASFAEADHIQSLAEHLTWPILADVTSQLRLGSRATVTVANPHLVCMHESHEQGPDVVFRFGGNISSKIILAYLRDQSAEHHVAVNSHPFKVDPENRPSLRIQSDIGPFCASLLTARTSPDDDWLASWTTTDFTPAFDAFLVSESPVSEPAVARLLTRAVPVDHVLYLANSMPIRDADMFADPAGRRVLVGANRGASGIDGTIASAVGSAAAVGLRATALVGDLAALHDLNSLAFTRDRRDIIVVINNDGGGIFSFLPIAQHTEVFEPWFTAPHGMNFASAARQFGLDYSAPETVGSFLGAYEDACASDRSTLIEVKTNRADNIALHQEIERYIPRKSKPKQRT